MNRRSALRHTKLLFLCFNFSVIAQDYENIVVTGSHLASQNLPSQYVLTQEQIQQFNPTSTTQLLASIPHLNIKENAGGAGQSFVSIRGGEANYTLVMIDGVAVNDPTNSRGGGFDFNQINVNTIQSIEVYRAGATAVYGSDAISGVINIITRSQDANSLVVSLGENGHQNIGVSAAGTFNKNTSGILSVSETKYDNNQYANFENKQFLGKLNIQLDSQAHQILTSFSEKDSKSLAEDSGGELYASPLSTEIRENKQFVVSLHSNFDIQAKSIESLTTDLSWAKHEENSNHPGILPQQPYGVPASNITSEYEESRFKAYLSGELTSNTDWLAGIAIKNKKGENSGYLDYGFELPVNFSLEQTDYSAFIESSMNINALQLGVSLRWENPEDFDSELSSRLAMTYELEAHQIFVSYNEGFKQPSFFALAHPLIGNKELKPEENQSYEWGISSTFGSTLSTELVWYKNDFKNLVDFDPELFLSVNRAEVETEGVELTVMHQPTSWLDFQLDIGYLDYDVISSDTELRRRPQWQAGFFANIDLSPFTLTLMIDSQSDVFDSSVPTGEMELGGYTVVDINTQWQARDNMILSFAIDNVLDKSYQESVGFFGYERQVRFGIEFKL